MVARNGGTIKLIDFGLSDADSYAILKSPAGTDGYVSPEQQKDSMPDVRNDIYSLGVILKEMHLGLSYHWVIKRCLCPMEQRYPNVHSLRMRIWSFQHRLVTMVWITFFLVLVASGVAIYNKVTKPAELYDVVAHFTVGNLEYKSWGGGLVTVCAANGKDSVIEIPLSVNYQGMSYRVDEIEDSAFAALPQLRRIMFPDNPDLHVMKHIFDDSPQLESISFRCKTPPVLGNDIWKVKMPDVFNLACFEHVVLYVPKGSAAAYRRSVWGCFRNIEEYK